MVDTAMQIDIRSKFIAGMDQDDQTKFMGAHQNGKLLPPHKPGNVMARLAMDSKLAQKGWSGQFITWSDERFQEYQD
jgi:hypothetical protein